MDQSARIQLPSAEDGEGLFRNIRIKNVSAVEKFLISLIGVSICFNPLNFT